MAPKQHQMDSVVDELASWIEDMSDQLVGAMSEGGIAPFAANVDQKQKMAYFTAKVYLPDGSINVQGRNELIQTYGPDGYASIVRQVLKSMGGLPPIPDSVGQG